MNLADLQRQLTQADPAAVLVSPRVLEQVVQEACQLRGVHWVVPHKHCYVVDRSVLFRHVEQEDLTLQSHQLLPARVILLARPKNDKIGDDEAAQVLLKYWRWLFHANVHLVLEDRWQQGLLPEGEVRSRVDQIGKTEFEEIRAVLLRDNYLAAADDDRTVYIEFAAVFLELRHFAPALLPVFFPALSDYDTIDKLFAKDFDAQMLFDRTRLEKAAERGPQSQDKEYESHEYYWKLMRSADRDSEAKNHVKAAISLTKAARVAPADLSPKTRTKAEKELTALTNRLREPLNLDEEQTQALFNDLKKLLDKADQGQQPVEATILYELQQICLDHEKDIYTLGPVEWLLSIGKRPIQRPLPSQRRVRIIRHLRSALGKLNHARITDGDRDNLSTLFQESLHVVEDLLRNQFRPILRAVMEDVGLFPSNAPERTAFDKMVEEFLDRILEAGFVTFGDLRDIISRNQLKMPDLADPRDFIHGDALIQLDRRLAASLDGVYRPSEVYMRWLERMTAMTFGTPFGRVLTRFVILPFVGAFLILEGMKILLKMFLPGKYFTTVSKQVHEDVPDAFGRLAGAEHLSFLDHTTPEYWLAFGLLGCFFLGLLHSQVIQRIFFHVGKIVGQALRGLFVELPVWLIRVPAFRRALASWPAQLGYWYVLKPAVLCALLYVLIPWFFPSWLYVVGAFAIVTLLLNTRTGQALTALMFQGLLDLIYMIRAGLLGGLYSFIVTIFKQVTYTIEYVLFTVDEWLRVRSGDSEISLVIRAVLSLLWFPVAFVARFYLIVLIEPMINPLKMPICIIAGKILLPALAPIAVLLNAQLLPVLGPVGSFVLVWGTWFFLPDAFGFLIWEMKENWSLYRSNRSKTIQPIAVGSHGETIQRLLRPGVHSGTVPSLFARLRHAEQQALVSGNYRVVRGYRKKIQEIKEDISRFVTRELLSLVHQSSHWEHKPLHVGEVKLSSNRISVQVRNDDFPNAPLYLKWEWRSPWLIAGMRDTGWLNEIPRESFWAVLAGLVYLYKVAGVKLVHEQIKDALPIGIASYDISGMELIVWLDKRYGNSISYDLRRAKGDVVPQTPEGEPASDWPTLDVTQLNFSRTQLTWDQLVETWHEQGDGYKQLVKVCICQLYDRTVEDEPPDARKVAGLRLA